MRSRNWSSNSSPRKRGSRKGGKGTIEVQGTNLHITQSLTVRREALIFCERLRLARGLPLKSKFPSALLTVDSPYEKLGTKLSRPTTFTFLAWTRLADVLRQWQETSSVTILVDWPALRDVEFTPVDARRLLDDRAALDRSPRRRARTAGPRLVGERWPDDPNHQP